MGKESSDRLVFEADGRLFSFRTSEVYKILETDRVYFVPGQSMPVSGVVTLSGTPVVVLNTFSLLSLKQPRRIKSSQLDSKAYKTGQKSTRLHKIIVLKDADKLLAFDIGSLEVSFILDPEGYGTQTDRDDGNTGAEPLAMRNIETGGRAVEEIDWLPYFNMAAEILSSPKVLG